VPGVGMIREVVRTQLLVLVMVLVMPGSGGGGERGR